MREPEDALPGRGPLPAFALLTRIPVGERATALRGDLSQTALYFPLVGAVVGAAGAGIGWAVSRVLPGAMAAVAAVLAMVVLTGAMHLDGLADSADGYGGQARERVIEIMHDHSLGTYGVIAVVADLAIRIFAVSALLGTSRGVLVLVAAGAISRSAVGAMSTLLPYAGGAEAGKGLGRLVARGSAPRAAVGVALAAAISGLLLGAYFTAGLLAAGAAVAGLWMLHCARRLGGYTGDLLGAMSELVEVACLVLAVGLLMH